MRFSWVKVAIVYYSSTLAEGGSDNGEIVKAGGEDTFGHELMNEFVICKWTI